ncbi:MAG: DUF711 family protein [Promethearchaeota archaeon]
MKIRAITIGQKVPFFNTNQYFKSFLDKTCPSFSNFCNDLIDEFQKVDLEVETKRICTQPIFSEIHSWKKDRNLKQKLSVLDEQISILDDTCKRNNFDYFSSCIMLANEFNDINFLEELITSLFPRFLKKHGNFFSSLMVASTLKGVNLTALKYCAKIIKTLSENPFNNLKFCVSCNVKSDTPFFPAAYHLDETPKFSLALEMADEVVDVFKKSSGLSEAQSNLKKRFNEIYELLTTISEKVSNKYDIEFHGIDFSPAPYPTINRSIGTAVEELDLKLFGSIGSLISVALIKNSIPKKDKVIGFSGFMQPVLEDYTIAKRLNENKFSLESLLLYSTICGTGLDCVPFPGDITERELFYILLDVAIISITHDKPLTARLMPMPGKKPGDDVEFDFEYFAKSKVIDIKRLINLKKKDIYDRNEKFFKFL